MPPSPERALAVKPPEGFRLLPGEYLIHTEPNLVTPYLPDPLAAAVALRGVPGVYANAVIDAGDGRSLGSFTAYDGTTTWVPDREGDPAQVSGTTRFH